MKDIIKVSDTEIGLIEPVEIQKVVNQLEFNKRQQRRLKANADILVAQISKAKELGLEIPEHNLVSENA